MQLCILAHGTHFNQPAITCVRWQVTLCDHMGSHSLTCQSLPFFTQGVYSRPALQN